jgi:hypothetical protein
VELAERTIRVELVLWESDAVARKQCADSMDQFLAKLQG